MTRRRSNIQALAPGATERQWLVAFDAVRRLVPKTRGTATLADSTTETVVDEPLATAESVIILMPTTAAAASEAWWINGQSGGSFTIQHSNDTTVRSFRYVVI